MLPIETTYVPSTEGVRVAVHDFGGDGPLLLLSHATGFCANVYQPMIEPLRSRFHCLALDLRAHGLTELPAGASLAWPDIAEDFVAVARQFAPDGGLMVFGHSLGASCIILAEARYPGLVDRAWVYEPVLLPAMGLLEGDDEPEIARRAGARRATFGSRAEALERYGSRPPLGLLDRRALEAYVDHGFRHLPDGSITLRCRPEQEALVFANHGSGAFELLGDLRIPLLIGVGADPGDAPNPARWVRDAAVHHGTLTVVDYPDLTHFGPLQAPDRLADDVAMFMLGEVRGI